MIFSTLFFFLATNSAQNKKVFYDKNTDKKAIYIFLRSCIAVYIFITLHNIQVIIIFFPPCKYIKLKKKNKRIICLFLSYHNHHAFLIRMK